MTLTATNASGSNATTRTVTVTAAPVASFSYSPTSPIAGQAVAFTDTSTGTPTSWSWSFGDGGTSSTRNPSHTFAAAGSFTVRLTATNASGSNATTRTVTVTAAPVASFSYSPTSPVAGQAVTFTDTSTGTPTAWLWDFNDGATSTTRNPSHSFATSGTYTVVLTITHAAGTSSVSVVVSVSPVPTLSASFAYSPSSPAAGQAVTFTDTSAGTPTSWSWSFGDGGTSASQNPSHTFTATGSYTVALTVGNASGTDTVSRVVAVVSKAAVLVDHRSIGLSAIPSAWISQAKTSLHIAYGHTSHGSQLTTGMAGLAQWKGTLYSWNNGGSGGALDIRDYYGNFGNLGIANDLGADINGNLDYTAWARATRAYLPLHPEINVVIWSWCYQAAGSAAQIQLYLDQMDQLEKDFPGVKFVYMTGHVDGEPPTGNEWQIPLTLRNRQIRDYCAANNKILYDFADIESYDPDGDYFGDKLVNDACDYDSNGDGTRDSNWAVIWQNAHPGLWYQCEAAHTQPLNANLKAYAAWWLWARLAGWTGSGQ